MLQRTSFFHPSTPISLIEILAKSFTSKALYRQKIKKTANNRINGKKRALEV